MEEKSSSGQCSASDDDEEQINPSISPKISRPKLPEFIGNERVCPGHHGRSKTDPGQGAEIKALIDKTMEDIKELQQVDFKKTYSRPKTFPKAKSQSTHVSPFTSPIPSPSVEENPLLNRNRSRSLKVLTDILKSGRMGVEQQRSNPTEDGAKSISDSQLLSGKMKECDRRSSSDGLLGSPGKIIVTEDQQQSQAIRKGWIHGRKSDSKSPALSDDEGLDSEGEQKQIGHTDTNSRFLMLHKIGAPKRRPAYAGLMQIHKPLPEPCKSDEPSYKRLQRVELRPISSNGRKTSNSRHITHPPNTKTTFPLEQGAVDTNGFGSLSHSYEAPPTTSFDLESQPSDISLADSQLGQSLVSEDVSINSEIIALEKPRNGRGSKPKSKSDPIGSKSIDNADIPGVLKPSHSSPHLAKQDTKEEEEEIVLNESQHTDLITDLDNDNSHVPLQTSQSFDESFNKPPLYVSSFTFEDSTPTDNSPQYLTLPNTNKKNIARSVSSASVLQRERKYLDRENSLRKHSIASSECNPVSLFPPSIIDVQSTSMPTLCKKENKDKRYHIVEELYRNEQEYVDALSTLKDKYMLPLKLSSNVDDNIVDNIFYMVPEILMHHTVYKNALDKVWRTWDTKSSTVGNVIISTFSKNTVLDCYLSFVENFKTSGKEIENIIQNKSSIQRFIEQCHRDSGSKLTMKDLIVRPVQRIPRYELLIQRLIENTPSSHPDYDLLKEADRVLHNFAIKLGTLDENRQEEDCQDSLKRLELLLLTDLVSPDRQYIRHDMVQIISKKDQSCVWTFSDLIIISSVKRRSGTVPRKTIILKSTTGQDFAENIKQKVWVRVGLDDVEVVKTESKLNRKPSVDPEQIEQDIHRLNEINDIATQLSCQHSELDVALKDLLIMLNNQLSEIQARMRQIDSNKLDIIVTTQEGVFPLEICFSSSEKRSAWEAAFYDAKQKLAILSNKRAPEFLQPLQITKTRAGMQFSCAAAIDGVNCTGFRDVWVCNSDGYVGHMCLLSLQPEPIVTLNTPVPGCNSRILCICAVPAYNGIFRRKSSSKKGKTATVPDLAIKIEEDQEVDEEGYQSDEELSEDDSDEDREESDEEEDDNFNETEKRDLFVSEIEVRRPPPSDLTQSSPDTITVSGNWTQDAFKSTMWLGTEDGCIHIFQCTDNIKTTKNKLKIHHGSPVYCIVYLDNKVFVSLANGDLIVYKRDTEGIWDTENPYTRTIGTVTSPINRMLAVAGKLWCGCQNMINVINPLTLRIESSFQESQDSNRSVQCMVTAGQGVWIAPHQSSKVLLHHATSYEFLLEVNIAHAVTQKLQSADDIIRQHKAACLRITALLICKDLLWVGTSAGVILTIPMPRITSTTTRGQMTAPSVTGLVYGHTGHVRFLTCVEMNAAAAATSSRTDNEEESTLPENLAIKDMPRRSSVAATTATMATRMLVISGGDGYEDFRTTSANESAGRDDSTNHLLLWHV
ncbi:rho guanine nucleotide exchange factor 17-like [Mytilus californianus]|uniref:rho guanine nucleotide exchange factor 17-like n=1 Tax=Mytilus californianus TaxID=6549 RepID=UPI002247FE0F|nr:rho guanine nucleotide exchange factor 17-like [Mytilus californianus]XP_052078649.1 rho guanine nucleotide exchange factor 17-like [Mytilus californianus]